MEEFPSEMYWTLPTATSLLILVCMVVSNPMVLNGDTCEYFLYFQGSHMMEVRGSQLIVRGSQLIVRGSRHESSGFSFVSPHVSL